MKRAFMFFGVLGLAVVALASDVSAQGPGSGTGRGQDVGPGSGTGRGRDIGPGSGSGMGRCRPVRVRECGRGDGDGRGPRCVMVERMRC